MKLDGRWASFDLEMFCQHCDQYLTSRTRVERKGLDQTPHGRVSAKKPKSTRTP